MTKSFESLAGLNKLIHEPARLAILTALSACKSVDFMFLKRLTGLTRGNLSTHLAKLEEVGLVQIKKQFKGKKPNTIVRLTNKGQEAIEKHWRQLERLRKETNEWKPEG